jgi:hypothetical protein
MAPVLHKRSKATIRTLSQTIQPRRGKQGQSLIESCVVIAVVSLLMMGMLQLSQIIAAKEVLHHAAMRGARAKSVGLNRFMVEKVVDVASIPNAGRMLQPDYYENDNPWLQDLVQRESPGTVWDETLAATPTSMQYPIERARVPEYLAGETISESRFLLDYEDWNDISYRASISGSVPGGNPATDQMLRVRANQAYRLWVPMHRSFFLADDVDLEGEAYMESHYALYLEDMSW